MLSAAAALLVLAGCGASSDPFAELDATQDAVPDYRTTNTDSTSTSDLHKRSATLVDSEATEKTARAAMADNLDKGDAVDMVELDVVRDSDSGTYVCRLRYATSERAAEVWMGESGEAPIVDLNCPSGQ